MLVVRAPVGTGKTFALDAAREGWQASGGPVLGCALSAKAAGELRDQAAIDATTVARLTYALDNGTRLAPGSVLVVDEAGMVGTRNLARLLDAAEQGAGQTHPRRRRSPDRRSYHTFTKADELSTQQISMEWGQPRRRQRPRRHARLISSAPRRRRRYR